MMLWKEETVVTMIKIMSKTLIVIAGHQLLLMMW